MLLHNKSLPLVSVCIPVFNCEEFVHLAIKSVLCQMYQNIELIILDNASTDQTESRILEFNDPRIRYIKNDANIGMKGNWNKALIEARGFYIKLLPADDEIFPDCIEKQVNAFENTPGDGISLVCCGREVINPFGKKLISRYFPGVKGKLDGKEAIRRIIRSGTNLLGEPGAILFRKDLIDRTGYFDNTFPYVIDLAMWIKMLRYGDLFSVPENLCTFRISPSSESVNSRHSHSRDFSGFINELSSEDYGLSKTDVYSGILRSYLLEYLRRVFYRFTKLFIR